MFEQYANSVSSAAIAQSLNARRVPAMQEE
ncbi:hypothetical protein [Agrobacterium tumefaciens]